MVEHWRNGHPPRGCKILAGMAMNVLTTVCVHDRMLGCIARLARVAAGDPVLAAPFGSGAVKEADVMVTEGVQSGSLVTFSQASNILAVPQQFSQDASMQSSSDSGNPAASLTACTWGM